ncbi:MAG: hypothetical protein WCE30_06195 [Mycobacterium sp.]
MTELLVLHIAKQEIQAVTLDGSRVRTLVGDVDETPDGIVVDQARGHIYWTNMGTPDPGSGHGSRSTFFTRNGSIERVNLDGSDRRTVVPPGAFTTGKQLTADFDAGLLYWCDREGMQVLCCRLDGSDLQTLVVAGRGEADARDARNHCVGVALDPERRLVYWTQKGAPDSGQGRIFRCGSDIPAGQSPADRTDIELLGRTCPNPSTWIWIPPDTWCGPTAARSRTATRSIAARSSRRSGHTGSCPGATRKRSVWRQPTT